MYVEILFLNIFNIPSWNNVHSLEVFHSTLKALQAKVHTGLPDKGVYLSRLPKKTQFQHFLSVCRHLRKGICEISQPYEGTMCTMGVSSAPPRGLLHHSAQGRLCFWKVSFVHYCAPRPLGGAQGASLVHRVPSVSAHTQGGLCL